LPHLLPFGYLQRLASSQPHRTKEVLVSNCKVVVSFLFFLLQLGLTGCASNHNLDTDGHSAFGGGFTEKNLAPGLFKVIAIANLTPWPNTGAAISTLRARGTALCGSDAFQEIVDSQGEGDGGSSIVRMKFGQVLALPKYNASIRAYVLCNSSRMTRDQAIKYVEDRRIAQSKEVVAARENALAELGGGDCSTHTDTDSPDRYLQRGKLLKIMAEYKAAMVCFSQAQRSEPVSATYRNACFEIATFYELGWGVERDIPTAVSWYKKARF
jgi:hypothetical protein